MGCGHVKEKGWLGVDIRRIESRIEPDIQADISKPPLPLPDNYADEIRAIHVIEHFYPWQVQDIVADWVRILKPGGQLAIECPDINKIKVLMDVPGVTPRMTFWALYGDPRHKSVEMMHHWCYDDRTVAKLMGACGLAELRLEPAKFHQPIRDMRVVGVKPLPDNRIVLPDA